MMAEIGLLFDNVSMLWNQSCGGFNGNSSDSFVTFDMVLIKLIDMILLHRSSWMNEDSI